MGGGEMGALMRSVDWSRTPVGPVESWPQSLRTAVSILLESRFPMYIAWGPRYVQFYNDGYRPILGSTKHPAAMGNTTTETFAEIWPIIGPMFDDVMRGIACGFEDHLLPLDRHGYVEECYFTFSYSPIRDESGGVGGVHVTVTETTERVLAERRLKILRDLAARASEASTEEAAWSSAAEVLAENPADVPFALLYAASGDGGTARLVGATTVESGTRAAPVSVALTARRAGWPLARVARARRPQTVSDVQERFGEIIGSQWPEPVRTALVLPIARPGYMHPYGLLVLGISPRLALDERYREFCELVVEHVATAVANARTHEEERRRAEALAELDRAKTTFFSNVSHEFRTPLTLTLGPLEDLLRRGDEPLPDAARQHVELAHRNGLRLLRLVNSFLDFSRIEAGRVQASFEPTDLAALTSELASVFRSAIERAGLRLVVDCVPIPEPVYVDREMWEKIVLNLLSNAFKFTAEGEIRVALRRTGDHVELAVSDTGTGISADELPHIFERFHRVKTPRARTQEGTGIGLALVQELVKLHGGAIRVDSRVSAGTTLTVTLPTGSAHLPANQVEAASTLSSTAIGAAPFVEEALRWLPELSPSADSHLTEDWGSPVAGLSGGRATDETTARVLLVDDNADMREYVRRLLAQHWTVESVSDGLAALAAARRQLPDLILADVMMPGLDGFELLREIRGGAETRAIPVILLSARAGEESRVEGLAAGADDYLIKPFSARELLARVESHLKLARLRAEVARREQATREQLEQLFLQAPAMVCVLHGPDHVYTLANPRYLEAVSGRPVVGKPIREALPELEGQGIIDLLDRVYSTGEPFVGKELPVRLDRREDGATDTAFFNFVYAPLRAADGSIDGVFVHGYEVTDQVLARAAAERAAAALGARARQQEAVAHLGQRALGGADLHGLMSEAVERIAATLEVEYCIVLELLPDRASLALRAGVGWQPGLVGSATVEADLMSQAGYTLASNEPVIVEDLRTETRFTGPSLLHEHGVVSGLSCIIQGRSHPFGVLGAHTTQERAFTHDDVYFLSAVANVLAMAVERRHAELERAELLDRERAARAEAEAAVRAREEFLSIASHELRNPVAGIKGMAQLIRRAREAGRLDPERLGRYISSIEAGSARLASLTEDLLDVSRLQQGELPLRRQRTDLAELVRDVMERRFEATTEQLRMDLACGSPSSFVDPDRIEQIIVNLIENALKYSPDGGEIRVSLEHEGGGLLLRVCDHGIGLPFGAAERIFQPFGRASNATSANIPGLGLGLYICRRIAEQHAGRLWAESSGEGRGTAVSLWLPIDDGGVAEPVGE